jgi:hypothetical protein
MLPKDTTAARTGPHQDEVAAVSQHRFNLIALPGDSLACFRVGGFKRHVLQFELELFPFGRQVSDGVRCKMSSDPSGRKA